MKKKLLIMFVCALILLTFSGCNNSGNIQGNSDDLLKKNHTVVLVVDSISNKELTIDDGETLIINFTPQKSNYTFNGWYTDSNCTVAYDFSRPVTTSFKLYAGFVLTTKTIKCQDIKLKALSGAYDNDETFALSLVGFDYDYLEKNNMGLRFNITYTVKYKKDYDVLWDIGYAGAPKYELSLINSDFDGYFEVNLTTTTKGKQKNYIYTTPLYFTEGQQISLIFSTDNVQNIITVSDIVVVIDAVYIR